ncbi:unnamed protein product [Phytophthora fragariaefolia]|uniref:Unnamed protein product n=1 Tax=Phytophthora fragariaefolia TaxID=1490495 RepID=A0A9W6YCQ3_9STRA|nr:unnamed protein product [Phytophthora fragariaefolia]
MKDTYTILTEDKQRKLLNTYRERFPQPEPAGHDGESDNTRAELKEWITFKRLQSQTTYLPNRNLTTASLDEGLFSFIILDQIVERVPFAPRAATSTPLVAWFHTYVTGLKSIQSSCVCSGKVYCVNLVRKLSNDQAISTAELHSVVRYSVSVSSH